MYCYKCGTPLEDQALFCSKCGAPAGGESDPPAEQPSGYVQSGYTPEPIQPLPMKWYKFLIYFALILGPILNAINGIQMITGAQYDGAADTVYAVFEGLKALDVIVGILLIAVAALGFYTRQRLAGYYQNGPRMVTLMYGAVIAINVIHLIGTVIVLPSSVVEEMGVTSFVSSIITGAIMIAVNYRYFQKRAHLFVN